MKFGIGLMRGPSFLVDLFLPDCRLLDLYRIGIAEIIKDLCKYIKQLNFGSHMAFHQ